MLIGLTAWKVLSANIGILADSARLEPFEVRRVALEIPEVRGASEVDRGARPTTSRSISTFMSIPR